MLARKLAGRLATFSGGEVRGDGAGVGSDQAWCSTDFDRLRDFAQFERCVNTERLTSNESDLLDAKGAEAGLGNFKRILARLDILKFERTALRGDCFAGVVFAQV